MRTIKGLTIKQWSNILGLPALIAAEFALIMALSGDVANTAAFMVGLFVFSICLASYISSAVNAYHEYRGERMSRKDMEKALKLLKCELDYHRGTVAQTRKDFRYELEKIRMDLRRIDLREKERDKE